MLSLVTLLVTTLMASAAGRQAAPARTFNPTDTLPFDQKVATGTLPNGLTFYVRQNARPAKRVLLRLAVKAGSLDEADDQQGLAHMLEHMAFNGSAHFKPGELISYFESTGARLGPHVNASTGFEETIYMLDLPTDKPEVVEKGFTALADFAGGLTLDPKEIDKERGVVIEEWRGGLGAGSRIRDKQIPVLYYNSRYAERLPIGKPEILRTFTPERLRAFYETFYRPDRMLYAYYQAVPRPAIITNDEIFPRFIVTTLPHGISGLVIAAIFAAAMSNLSGSLNSLASITVIDFYQPLKGGHVSDDRLLALSRWCTAGWGLVLIAIAIIARGWGSVFTAGLTAASIVYGPMLGAFILGVLTTRANSTGAITGMSVATIAMIVIWATTGLAWTWYVLVGSAICWTVGYLVSLATSGTRGTPGTRTPGTRGTPGTIGTRTMGTSGTGGTMGTKRT